MKKILRLIFAASLAVFLCGVLSSDDTYARPSTSALTTKAYVNAMGKCSNDTFFASPFNLYDLQGLNSLTTNNSTSTINTPNGLTPDVNASISCKTLFSKYVPNTSKIPSTANDRNAARNALVAIGYGSDDTSSDTTKNCGEITYRDSSNTVQSSGQLCFNTDGNGNISSGEISARNDFPDTSKTVSLFYGSCPEERAVCLYYRDYDKGYSDMRSFGGTLTSTATWSEVESRINSAVQYLGSITYQTPTADGFNLQYREVQYQSILPETNTIPERYIYSTDNTRNASRLVDYFGGYANWDSAGFTDQEKYWFYVDILDNYYGVSYDNSTCQLVQFDGAIIMRNQDGGLRWCKVGSASKNIGTSVNIFPGGNTHYLDATADLSGVISALGSLDFFQVSEYKTINEETGAVTDPEVDPDPDPSGSESNTDDSLSDECYGAKGTLGLSWIICPVLTMLSNTLNDTYQNIVEQFLVVEPGLYSVNRVDQDSNGNTVTTDQPSETYRAWQIFQSFANILVVILLLVVIFSQLTGIGIDNYGIKKILPRLIIVAVLINLSYFIVQFVIDVSNIVGSGIMNIFPDVDLNNIGSLERTTFPETIVGISLGGMVGAAGAIGVSAIMANPALLLALVLVVISSIISTLMMWLILIARKAGIVIAIVIAPVAFAAYLLPNTSKFAKTWINVVKSLVLVYPLAALLIGASYFASSLIATTNNGLILAAMLLRVVPFLALPTIFRKSLDAVGNIGTKIQSVGQGLGRSTTGALRNTDWYKNLQERGLENKARVRAGLDRNGQETTSWLGRRLRAGDNRARSRYRSQYLKNQAEQDRASLLNDPRYMEEMRFKQDLALEGERNEIELMNDPNYRESLRANQQEALEKKQKDVQASMLKTGKFSYTDAAGVEHTITDPSNGGALTDALVAELSKSDGDISKINALYDAIRAKGDAGIDLLSDVWDSGTINANGRNFAEFRDKIVADGEIKSKARTLHSVAKDVQSGARNYNAAGSQVANARTAGTYVKDIAAEKVPDLTSKEMAALNARAQAGDTVAQETIYRTMANQELNSKVKPSDRDNVLWSASQYLQNNFRQIDHTNDRTETWRDSAGRTRQVGITPEGLRYDKQSGANYGKALDIRQMNANWTRTS